MNLPRFQATWLLLFLASLAPLDADDFPTPRNTQDETERFLSPAEALAALQVPAGFRVTLFAHEPEVRNPIDVCTDARGRLWVAENYTYAERELNYDLTLNDRILILEDTDGDGRHDRRKVFWDRGKKLTSVAVGFGGVWATCAPHLLFIPDRDGDDLPDGEPVIVLEGFDSDSIRHNIVNGLNWGPDGWLYGRHGIQATSRVGVPGSADAERIPLNCCVWRYHPVHKTFEVVAQGTTNPWGMDWDAQGECWLINTVIGHLWHVVPGAYWKRMYGSHFNPHLYELIDQTADHIHWAEGENWSHVRQHGISATTDAAGGGHAHCGLVCCDAAWPPEFRGSLLTGNLHGRRLNRDVLERDGCGYVAHHAPDFLRSGDPYFRVVELEHARHGGMYIVDWSDIGECHENDGVHRTSGRIYRLTWDAVRPDVPSDVAAAAAAPDLARLTSPQLVALQRHPAEWTARTARRVLQERTAAGEALEEAAAALEAMIESDESPILTLRALWCLNGMERLTRQRLLGLIARHPDEHVRAWSVRLLIAHPEHPSRAEEDAALLATLAARETSGLVRLYLASLLSRLELRHRLSVARELARREEDVNDRQQPLLLWYGVEPVVPTDPAGALLLARETPMWKLARFIARRLTQDLPSRPGGVAQLVQLVGELDEAQQDRRRELLAGMVEALRGWRRAQPPEGWGAVSAKLMHSSDEETVRLARELSVVFGDGRAVEELRKIAADGRADMELRRAALRSLVEARAEGLEPLLRELVGNRDYAIEAIRGLAALGGPDAARLIADRYNGLRLEAKEEAVTALVSRPDFSPVLLDAVAAGKIPPRDVPPFQLRQMLSYGNDAWAGRIRKLWPELEQLAESKQQRIRELTALLTPETLAAADLPRGRSLFNQACAKCHKLFGEGGATAPELTGAQRTNLAYLLENIVDPSATISKNFQMSVVLLDDGRVLNGIVLEQTDRTITLQTPTEGVVLDRGAIVEVRETNLSLMPEGQLDRLTPEEIRDLIGYLMSPTQVALP